MSTSSTRTFTSQTAWACGAVIHRTDVPEAWNYESSDYTPTDCSSKLSHYYPGTTQTCNCTQTVDDSVIWFNNGPLPAAWKVPTERITWVGPNAPDQ